MTTSSAATATQARPRLDHLSDMMIPAGIVQFSRARTPDLTSGTCLDDNARVWLVAMQALSADPGYAHAREAGDTAAAFVAHAQHADGTFHNLADSEGRFLDDVGSEDSIGRAIWACGTAVRCADVAQWRDLAADVLDAALPAAERLAANHGRAYAVLGLSAALAPDCASLLRPRAGALPHALRYRMHKVLTTLADSLDDDFRSFATDDWPWWTDTLTWGNGRLPEAMLRAYAATGTRRYAESGLRALEFLAGITQQADMFVPIGNEGWYPRGGARARYDQQPIEACAMTDAWLAVHRLTDDAAHLERARVAVAWFHGANTERLALAVPETGACHDGLLRGAVNRNQGAESTLSFLHASLALDAATVR